MWLSFFMAIFLFFSYANASASNPSAEKILTIKTTKNISLPELIKSSGYYIVDNDIGLFLKDFASLNRNIKSLSMISKGTTVRLPVKNLKAKAEEFTTRKKVEKIAPRKKVEKIAPRKKVEEIAPRKEVEEIAPRKEVEEIAPRKEVEEIAPRKEVEKVSARKGPPAKYQLEEGTMILKNIKILLDSLTEGASMISEGIKIFSVNYKGDLSFNTSFFPIIELADNRVIMLDYQGILPEEIKDVMKIFWPEYKIVSNYGKKDTKNIIRLFLDSIGYSIFNSNKVILGERTRIEFSADFLGTKKSDDIHNGEIIVISIIKPDEYSIPSKLKEWAEKRRIRIIELFLREPPLSQGMAKIVYMSEKEVDKFSEEFLTLLGREFNRGDYLRLSDREEYEFNIRADLTIASDYGIKIIDFSKFPEPTIRYVKKHGFDMICISPREKRSEVVRKILELLSINYKDKPEAISSYITPKGVKYRIIAPGILVKSKNGVLFLPDPEDTEFPSSLVSDDVTLIKF